MTPTNKYRIFFYRIWTFIKTWQSAYLMCYFIGQILALTLKDPNNRASVYLPLVLLISSFGIKIAILIVKEKTTLKQFLRMQLDFASPYVLMVVNIVLAMKAVSAFNQAQLFRIALPNLMEFGTVAIINFVIGTLICSFIMNKKTKKLELIMIVVIILLQAGSSLNANIGMINHTNELSDLISEYQHQALVQFTTGKMSLNEYNQAYQMMSQIQSAMDVAKDYMLAWVASIIAQLTIMIDLVFRPLQKSEHHQEIRQDLLNKLGSPEKTRQIELTEQKQTHERNSHNYN